MENLETQDQMQQPETPPSTWSTALNYGLIGGIALAILTLLVYFLELDQSATWVERILSIVIFATVVIIATKHHRDQKLNGFISFGKAFLAGFLTVLIMALFGAIFNYFYIEFINPGILEEAEREMRRGMAQGEMSQEEMNNAMEFSGYFISAGFFAITGFIGNLIIGAIIALIGAAIYQRES